MPIFFSANYKHSSSFVRRASLIFLSKLYQIQNVVPLPFNLEEYFQEETEAIVRRELTLFVSKRMSINNEKVIPFMLLASQDLDWEVKQISFHFWSHQFENQLQQHSDFQKFTQALNENRILEGLEWIKNDYEREIQCHVYQWLLSIQTQLSDKYQGQIEVCSKVKQFIYSQEELQVKLQDYEEYCQHHFGLLSVLEDIIQLEANQCSIDTIDCF